MKKHPFRAIHSARTGSLTALLTTCAAIAVFPVAAGPVLAAQRTVLCEEFTNKW